MRARQRGAPAPTWALPRGSRDLHAHAPKTRTPRTNAVLYSNPPPSSATMARRALAAAPHASGAAPAGGRATGKRRPRAVRTPRGGVPMSPPRPPSVAPGGWVLGCLCQVSGKCGCVGANKPGPPPRRGVRARPPLRGAGGRWGARKGGGRRQAGDAGPKRKPRPRSGAAPALGGRAPVQGPRGRQPGRAASAPAAPQPGFGSGSG
jgi:hypothetical protein